MSNLEEQRLKIVRDHMTLEITHEWDAVIDTFAHPRYELYGNGAVFDGEEAVRAYFALSRTPFPDQANEVIAIGAAGEHVVLVEFGCGWRRALNLRRGRTGLCASGLILVRG